jgi:hypothetical protein
MIHGRHSVEESFSKYYVALIERYAGCWLMVAGCWLLRLMMTKNKKHDLSNPYQFGSLSVGCPKPLIFGEIVLCRLKKLGRRRKIVLLVCWYLPSS